MKLALAVSNFIASEAPDATRTARCTGDVYDLGDISTSGVTPCCSFVLEEYREKTSSGYVVEDSIFARPEGYYLGGELHSKENDAQTEDAFLGN